MVLYTKIGPLFGRNLAVLAEKARFVRGPHGRDEGPIYNGMITNMRDFMLAERQSAGNGWQKLMRFMADHPTAFVKRPNRNAEMLQLERQQVGQYLYWGVLSEKELRSLSAKPEDGGEKQKLFELQLALAGLQKTNGAELKRFGIANLREMPEWVALEDGECRVQPHGTRFGDRTWSGNALLMPYLGAGVRKVAHLGRNGWVLKRLTRKDAPTNDTKEMYDLMAAHPEIFARVRGYRAEDGSYWQERLDEKGSARMWKKQPDAAYEMYHDLVAEYEDLMSREQHDVLMGGMDFSESHNIGLNEDGQMRIFDF